MATLSRPGSYDLPKLRKQLIEALSKNLRKESNFYDSDYEAIVRAVNRKTARDLRESLDRTEAVARVSAAEVKRHCIFR